MNTYTWIFTGLLVVTLILYILGQVNRIMALEKIARVLFMPFIAGIILSILTVYLPDSHHILVLSTFAYAAATLFMLNTLKDKKRFLKMTEGLFFILNQSMWGMLIFSVYRIYRVPTFVYIIAGIIYLAGFIVLCILVKKQSLVKYTGALILYAFSAYLGLTTLLSLIYEKRLFSVLMFTGSIAYMLETLFIIIQRTRPFDITEKTEKFVITIMTVCTAALMGAGAVLMQI